MSSCIDEKIGELISPYEFGQLEEPDRERFETHLSDCVFCRTELKKMSPLASKLWLHRDDIVKRLREEGYEFEQAKGELISSLSQERPRRHTDAWTIRRFFDNLLRPRILVPAMVTTAVVVLVLLLSSPTANHDERLPYPLRPPYAAESEYLLRDNSLMTGDQYFRRGISDYSVGKYGSAIVQLRKAVAEEPDQGEWRLYLGVACYLDGQYSEAIQALSKADSLILPLYQPHARWYLAQSYLKSGKSSDATQLLQWLCDRGDNNMYTDRAGEELARIGVDKNE